MGGSGGGVAARRRVRVQASGGSSGGGDGGVPAAEVFERAFREILPGLSDRRRRMLAAHVRAPGHAMTPHELATVAEFKNYRAVNPAYGGIGKLVGEATGYQPQRLSLQGKECKTFAFADWDAATGSWVLYPSVVKALTKYGLDK